MVQRLHPRFHQHPSPLLEVQIQQAISTWTPTQLPSHPIVTSHTVIVVSGIVPSRPLPSRGQAATCHNGLQLVVLLLPVAFLLLVLQLLVSLLDGVDNSNPGGGTEIYTRGTRTIMAGNERFARPVGGISKLRSSFVSVAVRKSGDQLQRTREEEERGKNAPPRRHFRTKFPAHPLLHS